MVNYGGNGLRAALGVICFGQFYCLGQELRMWKTNNPESLVMYPESLVMYAESLVMYPESLVMYAESLVMYPELLVMYPESLVLYCIVYFL